MTEMMDVLKTSKHRIQVPKGSVIQLPAGTRERKWRDSELQRTDLLSLLTDYPNQARLIAYRNELRNYPSTPDFANKKRPTE